MSMRDVKGRGVLVAMNDLVASTLLVIWGLILGPLGLLRGTLYLGNIFWYIWILSPQALLSRFVRAAIDWRLGNFDAAVFQLEFLVTRVEAAFARHQKSRHIRIVLEDFYTLLVRAYLHGGHIDDAMLVILRAKKSLDCDRLPEIARLDAKTAHLVRAGLAAGRLLDGTGLATLYVKASEKPPIMPPPPPTGPRKTSTTQAAPGSATTPSAASQQRQGATSQGYSFRKNNIIPFPSPLERGQRLGTNQNLSTTDVVPSSSEPSQPPSQPPSQQPSQQPTQPPQPES